MAATKKAVSSESAQSTDVHDAPKKAKSSEPEAYVPGTGVPEIFKGPTTADLNPAYNDPTE